MTVSVSQAVVLVFGIVVGVLSIWGIIAPTRLISIVRSVMDRGFGIYAAVIARVLLGVALIIAAAESRFPTGFEILGWIAIAAAVGLAFIGRERLRKFIGWFDRFSPAQIRLWLVLGIVFGGFLVYGVS